MSSQALLRPTTKKTFTELLSNTGFELLGAGAPDIFTVWSETVGTGAIADEASLVHAGSHAVKITAGSSKNTSVGQLATVVPGYPYRVSFWSRGDGSNSGRYRVLDVTGGYAGIIAMVSTGITGTDYAQVTNTFNAPAGCVQVILSLYCSAVEGGIAYFDDASLLQMR